MRHSNISPAAGCTPRFLPGMIARVVCRWMPAVCAVVLIGVMVSGGSTSYGAPTGTELPALEIEEAGRTVFVVPTQVVEVTYNADRSEVISITIGPNTYKAGSAEFNAFIASDLAATGGDIEIDEPGSEPMFYSIEVQPAQFIFFKIYPVDSTVSVQTAEEDADAKKAMLQQINDQLKGKRIRAVDVTLDEDGVLTAVTLEQAEIYTKYLPLVGIGGGTEPVNPDDPTPEPPLPLLGDIFNAHPGLDEAAEQASTFIAEVLKDPRLNNIPIEREDGTTIEIDFADWFKEEAGYTLEVVTRSRVSANQFSLSLAFGRPTPPYTGGVDYISASGDQLRSSELIQLEGALNTVFREAAEERGWHRDKLFLSTSFRVGMVFRVDAEMSDWPDGIPDLIYDVVAVPEDEQ